MATTTIMKYCATCQRKTPHIKQSTSNVLHLLLSVVTVGLWLPVWFILGLRSTTSRPACTQCGNDTFLGMAVVPPTIPYWVYGVGIFAVLAVIGSFMK